MSVIDEIAAERRRQIEVEGWTPEHDDTHACRELAAAAGCYVTQYVGRSWLLEKMDNGALRYECDGQDVPDEWPPNWPDDAWKPKSPRRDLIRAAALIVAEIERIDRAEAARHE